MLIKQTDQKIINSILLYKKNKNLVLIHLIPDRDNRIKEFKNGTNKDQMIEDKHKFIIAEIK
jgi:hypothetical protein